MSDTGIIVIKVRNVLMVTMPSDPDDSVILLIAGADPAKHGTSRGHGVDPRHLSRGNTGFVFRPHYLRDRADGDADGWAHDHCRDAAGGGCHSDTTGLGAQAGRDGADRGPGARQDLIGQSGRTQPDERHMRKRSVIKTESDIVVARRAVRESATAIEVLGHGHDAHRHRRLGYRRAISSSTPVKA